LLPLLLVNIDTGHTVGTRLGSFPTPPPTLHHYNSKSIYLKKKKKKERKKERKRKKELLECRPEMCVYSGKGEIPVADFSNDFNGGIRTAGVS